MYVTAERQKDDLIIFADGEMDEHSASNARRVADSVIEEHRDCRRVVFDLEKVSFMDSTGIGFLIGRFKLCKRYGISAYVRCVNPTTDKILSVSGVYSLLPRI